MIILSSYPESVHSLLVNLVPFFWAVVDHLTTFLGGCAITYIVNLVVKYRLRRELTLKQELLLFTFFFFCSLYQAWNDQFIKNEELQKALGEKPAATAQIVVNVPQGPAPVVNISTPTVLHNAKETAKPSVPSKPAEQIRAQMTVQILRDGSFVIDSKGEPEGGRERPVLRVQYLLLINKPISPAKIAFRCDKVVNVKEVSLVGYPSIHPIIDRRAYGGTISVFTWTQANPVEITLDYTEQGSIACAFEPQ